MEQALWFVFQHTANRDLLALPFIQRDPETPFILAHAYPKYIKHLIEIGSPTFFTVYNNLKDVNWCILFNTAVRWDNLPVVQRILEDNKIDLKEHQTICDVFDMACRWQSWNVVGFFLENTSVQMDTKMHSTYFCHAIRDNRMDVFELMLKHPKLDPSHTEQYVFRYALERNQLAFAKRLLEDPRIDPAIMNNYCICTAAKTGNIQVVELLLADPRVDPSVWDNIAFRQARANRHMHVVARLAMDPRVRPVLVS